MIMKLKMKNFYLDYVQIINNGLFIQIEGGNFKRTDSTPLALDMILLYEKSRFQFRF